MGYTKRTTRSTGKGSRTTSTKTVTNKGNTKQTTSRSTGSKVQRYTSSTNINSGARTKQYITTNMGGWRKTTLLNPVTKSKSFKKSRKYFKPKTSALSFGFFGWSFIIFILILIAYS